MDNNTSKKSFILYYDSQHLFNMLADTQAGKLIKAIYEYEINGTVPNCDDDIAFKMAFTTIQLCLDRDKEKYNSVCERNRLNGQKGGRPKKLDNHMDILETQQKLNNSNGFSNNPNNPIDLQDNPNNPVGYLQNIDNKNTKSVDISSQNAILQVESNQYLENPKNPDSYFGNPKKPKKADNDNDNDNDNDSDIDNVNDSDKDNESVNDIVKELIKSKEIKNNRKNNKEKSSYKLPNGKIIYYENIGELKEKCDCLNCNDNALIKIDNKKYCFNHFEKIYNTQFYV